MNKITLIDLISQWIASDSELDLHFAISGHFIVDNCPPMRRAKDLYTLNRIYVEILETELVIPADPSHPIKLSAGLPNFFTMVRALLRKRHNDTKLCVAPMGNSIMVDPYDIKNE